jgi:hypothetical protein
MSKIELRFAELHAPLFMSDEKHLGKNFGMKLDHVKHRGIKLEYDREAQELIVTWEGREAIVPLTNVVSMQPAVAPPAKVVKLPETASPVAPKAKATAQVSTPQGHVFEGPGKGQTGQESLKAGKVVL